MAGIYKGLSESEVVRKVERIVLGLEQSIVIVDPEHEDPLLTKTSSRNSKLSKARNINAQKRIQQQAAAQLKKPLNTNPIPTLTEAKAQQLPSKAEDEYGDLQFANPNASFNANFGNNINAFNDIDKEQVQSFYPYNDPQIHPDYEKHDHEFNLDHGVDYLGQKCLDHLVVAHDLEDQYLDERSLIRQQLSPHEIAKRIAKKRFLAAINSDVSKYRPGDIEAIDGSDDRESLRHDHTYGENFINIDNQQSISTSYIVATNAAQLTAKDKEKARRQAIVDSESDKYRFNVISGIGTLYGDNFPKTLRKQINNIDDLDKFVGIERYRRIRQLARSMIEFGDTRSELEIALAIEQVLQAQHQEPKVKRRRGRPPKDVKVVAAQAIAHANAQALKTGNVDPHNLHYFPAEAMQPDLSDIHAIASNYNHNTNPNFNNPNVDTEEFPGLENLKDQNNLSEDFNKLNSTERTKRLRLKCPGCGRNMTINGSYNLKKDSSRVSVRFRCRTCRITKTLPFRGDGVDFFTDEDRELILRSIPEIGVKKTAKLLNRPPARVLAYYLKHNKDNKF